jgi:DNA-directed RNA polymerase specialized sigma24 family protein
MLKTLYPASERYRHNGELARVKFVAFEEPSQDGPAQRIGPEQTLLENDPDYGIDPGYDRVDIAPRDAHVRRFVADLPPNQRTIATAVFWEGQTHSQVAGERGISRPAVTRTLQRVYARGEKDLAEHQLALAA